MNSATGLAAARVVLGSVSVAAPEYDMKMFRLDPTANPQLAYLARMFGSREIALGAATLLARGKTRRNLILAGVGVDAADTVAAVLAGESGSVDRTTQVLLAVPAAVAVLAGLSGLRSRS
jgi:hypothetical protein